MQTYITQRLVSYLSDELNTTVSIRGVNIELFKTIVLEDVYIEDLHADTLLYASLLKVNIDDFNLKKHLLYINQIELEETTFNLRKYRGEEDNNLKFITDLFSREGESNVKWDIKLASVSIVKSKFSYANENKEWNGGAINFQDLRLTQINAEISNFKLEGDTIYGMVEELSCLEKSGFHLQNFQGEVKTSPTGMDVDSLIINTRASTIVASISFRYNKYRDFLSFVDSVQISSEFRESKVNMSDIAYFAPGLDGISYQYKLTGKVRGLISRLKGKNVELQFGNYSRLTGDFSLNGLPDVRETFIFFRVKDLRTQKSDIEKIPIPPFKERITLKVPPLVGNLGHIRFHGEFTGFYNDFVAYGDFHTSIGTLVSDLSLKEDTVANLIRYAGSLSSPGFNVGDFLSIEEGVGNAVFDVNIRGSGLKKTTAKANLKGVISSIFLNKYNYQNINLEGELQNRHYEGRFVVNDQNVNLLFNGEIDFLQSPPSFDFQASIAEANLAKLNLANEDSIAILSANLMSNFSGNDIDNMMGALKISEIIFQHRSSGDSIVQENLGDLNLTVKDEGGDRSLNLVSEFMNVEIKGNYSFGELIPSFAEILKDVIPSSTFVEQHSHKDHDNQEFSYEIEIKDASKISEILLPGIFIANGTNIKGEYSHDKKKFSLLANSPQVKLYGKTLSDWSINAQLKHSNDTSSGSTGNQLVINSSCEKLAFSDSAWLSNFNVKTITQNDSLYFNAQWNNESSPQYSGNINGYTLFKLLADSLDDDGDDLGKRVVQLSFLPSEFTITDSIWNIDKGNAITYDSTSIRFENLVVQSGNRKITVLGSSSVKDAGGIMLTIEDVELSLLNPLTKRNRLKWNGISNGSITVSNLFSDPYLTGTMNVSDLELNGKKVGNAALSGNWNSNAERVQILMNVTRGSLNTLAANGFYYLDSLHTAKGELIDIDVALVKMKIDILEPYLKTVFPDISDRSTASGKLVLSGSLKQPLLTGKLNIQRGGFTVGYINTKYNFADEIILDEKWIGFDNVVLNDLKGNRAVASGKIYHNHFRNFSYDISVEPVNLHTLNTTVAQNDVFYGQAFTTGKMKIEGDARGILLAPSLKTEKGTQVFIPLTGAEEVSGGGFVIFINPKDTLNGLSSKQNGNLQKKAGLLQVKFDLEITPEAEVQLIFDETVGDILKANGSGNLRLDIDKAGDIKIYGNYVIEQGDYLFTLQNVINKRFRIEKGSTIKWNGDPYSAIIDINAVYTLNASLYDLTLNNEDKKRVPVNCKLIMKGNLMNPEIVFDIDFPNTDASSKNNVKYLFTTEQQINKQMFSLLVLGKFQPAGGSGLASSSGSVGANSSELLSNQLSNWLSQISEDFDIGVNYRPGDELTRKELEVALSTQLFDDRLTVNGSVANNTDVSSQNSNNIVGDFNMDYKITKDGQLRVKAYNRANDTYLSTNNAPYTQGLGLFYKKEFNSIKDLFKRKNKSPNQSQSKD